jgi:hypothetical protein
VLLLREAESLAERLSVAEVEASGLLRPRQYAAVIRDAFDPFGRQSRSRSTLGQEGQEGVDPALMGPVADETSWSPYRTDSALHATYWIASWPRSDVGPMFIEETVPLRDDAEQREADKRNARLRFLVAGRGRRGLS